MSLRIIAGELGGRRIEAPAGRRTRPTPERVREAWFSAMGAGLEGARVLDLFAGSGALGIEALSRGAGEVLFVERDRRAAGVLRENLRSLGLEERGEVRRQEAFAFLAAEGSGASAYDLALADPPYGTGDALRLLERFVEGPFARFLWLEHDAGAADALDDVAAPAWRRVYGDTALSCYRPTEGADG